MSDASTSNTTPVQAVTQTPVTAPPATVDTAAAPSTAGPVTQPDAGGPTFPNVLTNKVNQARQNPPGDPRVGGLYPKAMEQGRMLEQSLGDAAHELAKAKQDLMDKIKNEISKALAACTTALPDPSRPGPIIAKMVAFIKQAKEFIQDVVAVVQGIIKCIQMLWTMIAALKGMIQSCLNALANLLQELCNWNLPNLPSLPNLFGLFMNFPGFNLPNFKALLKQPFAFNFSLKDCHIHLPNVNIFRDNPMGFTITDLLGRPIFHLPAPMTIPYSGQNVTLANLGDSEYVAGLQKESATPVYSYNFNPADPACMQGSLPTASYVINNFQLTKKDYKDNLLSISFPALVPKATDADYNDFNPGYVQANITDTAGAARIVDVRHTLQTQAVLGNLVASNWDPNLVSLWLNYLQINMSTRRGTGLWVPTNASNYSSYIEPSLEFLNPPSDPTQDVPVIPYNNIINGTGVQVGPVDLPIVKSVQALTAADQATLCWKLSYIEAGLLGIERNTTWDPPNTEGMISDWTQSLPSGSKATLNVPIYTTSATPTISLNYDKNWLSVIQQVISKGHEEIQNTFGYTTSRPQWKYVYNQFGESTPTDRFLQYWMTFQYNYTQLMQSDPTLINFVMYNPDILASAVDPLGDPTLFNALEADFNARDLTWVAGYPIPNIPQGLLIGSASIAGPTVTNSGWDSNTPNNMAALQDLLDGIDSIPQEPDALASFPVPDVPNPPTFDPLVFLSRPDVAGLPLNQQMAMLSLNEAYASLMLSSTTQIQAALDLIQDQQNQLTEANTVLQEVSALDTSQINSNTDIEKLLPSLSRGPASVTSLLPPPSPGDPDYGTPPKSNLFTAGSDLPDLTVVYYGPDQKVYPVTVPAAPTTTSSSGSGSSSSSTTTLLTSSTPPPYFDGIVSGATKAGDSATLVITYGSTIIPTSGHSFAVGGRLYLGANGQLTQDYSSLLGLSWIVCIGRVLAGGWILYEPNIPTQVLMMPATNTNDNNGGHGTGA
jgi:hypothetical protein